MAGDELEGRGVGSRGLDQAAEYIASQFAELGLKTDLFDGGPFQKFNMTTGTELGEVNRAELVGPSAPALLEPERTPGRAERPWPDSASPMPASTDQGRAGQVFAAAMYQAR